jgi:hypothetical protein
VVAAAAEGGGEGGDADEDHVMKKWAHETGSVWCIRNTNSAKARRRDRE